MKFKDFQAPALFSSTFKALSLGEKIQVLSRMHRNLHYLLGDRNGTWHTKTHSDYSQRLSLWTQPSLEYIRKLEVVVLNIS